MAQPSLFPSDKSSNPAVLKWRKNGIFRYTIQTNSIVRKQNVSVINGSSFPVNQKDKTRLIDFGIFRGGRGDNGFTSEFKFHCSTGKKTTELIDGNSKSSSFETKATSGYLSYALSYGNWGTEIHALNYNGQYNFADTLNGTSVSSNEDVAMNIYGLRQGYVTGFPLFALGLIFEFDRIRPKGSIEGVSSQLYYAGLGIGFGNDFRLELNAEVDPISSISAHTPIKVSGVLEAKINSFSFGYKAVWYEGKFIDLDEMLKSKMIYNHNGDSRLEHIVDVSFGSASGFDFGWIGIYTETTSQEKSTIFGGNESHYTYSKSFSFKIKIGKTF